MTNLYQDNPTHTHTIVIVVTVTKLNKIYSKQILVFAVVDYTNTALKNMWKPYKSTCKLCEVNVNSKSFCGK